MPTTAIESQLDTRERIVVTELHNNKKQLYFTFQFLLMLLVASTVYLFWPKWILCTLFFIIGISVQIFLQNEYKKYSSASLVGESIIINTINKRKYITSIRSVKVVKTKQLGQNIFTDLQFRLDGKKMKVLLISDVNAEFTPAKVISLAKNHLKNKRQIYKPGSVS